VGDRGWEGWGERERHRERERGAGVEGKREKWCKYDQQLERLCQASIKPLSRLYEGCMKGG
jgi:hypothetical protein